MEKKEQYVVVEFTETAEVATILRSWLKENENEETECWWPEKDVRRLLLNKTPPKTSWGVWKVRILTSCDSLKEALLKERKAQITSDLATESESEKGVGSREKKRPQRYSSTESNGSSESDLAPLNISVGKQKYGNKNNEKHSFKETPILVKPSTEIHLIEESPKRETSTSMQISSSTNCPHTNTCPHKFDISRLQEKVDRMERAIQQMKFDIKEMLEMLTILLNKQSQDTSHMAPNEDQLQLENKLPIQNLNDFLELENSLADNSESNMLVAFIQRIGGVTVEDTVRRILVRLFTNEVASLFSWEGRKGKRSLNNLRIIKLISRVVSNGPHKSTFNERIFEDRVKEWFRQAKTRMLNKKPKINSGAM